MWSILLPLALSADPAVGFDASVKPVVAANCLKCHSGERPRAGLDLSTAEKALAGAKSGPVIVAGKPDASHILQVVVAGHDTHMPPDGQLNERDIAAISAWIASLPAAAVAPRKELKVTDEDRKFWAFRPVAAVTPPGAGHPIDAFISQELKKKGLALASPAEKLRLIRRATFDVIGLPPTPEEIEAFVADASADAYVKLIDRLLASPHYGERWARHWLDLARYSDVDAPARQAAPDMAQPAGAAHHYRDYVIRSLNADKPYDRFIMEQIAGDELTPTDRDARVATGFLRLGRPSGAGGDKARYDDLDDTASTTSAVFLGMTLGCARCHDHKTDPLPQRDYYRLLAVFSGLQRKTTPVPSAAEEKSAAAGSTAMLAEQEKLQKELAAMEADLKDLREPDEIPPADFVGPPPASRWYKSRQKQIEKLRTAVTALNGEQAKFPQALTAGDVAGTAPAMYLLLRGDPRAVADEVTPGTPVVLPANEFTATDGRRLALAKWIARPEHPLTARVMVNRLWHYHFGKGLVGTPSNFGPGGDRPTHPELLDWLAGEFVRSGWSLKKMHRLILTSATYRQSSDIAAEAKAKDPDNKLWSRYPRHRLEAEAIRDALLYTSGRLNPVMFGPGSRPRAADAALAPEAARSPLALREGPQQARRSIYLAVNRSSPAVLLESFDAPPPGCPCDQRSPTTIPPQALLLMNGPFVIEQAGELALRVKKAAGTDPAAQVDRLFRVTLGRPPKDEEKNKALAFLANPAVRPRMPARRGDDPGALGELAHVIYNLNEFIYVD